MLPGHLICREDKRLVEWPGFLNETDLASPSDGNPEEFTMALA
jgi:hypothetical protein